MFSMEYEAKDDVSGIVPQFGAIFMSNLETKKECFRLHLLGLPSAQANFVKQIKAGMILFLFEFETRELYGVFQAVSDGAMSIVPHAFSSSGKQFPAQVRFNPIWDCSPLSEHEFRDAIKENYFSKNKFNFGLSRDQVRKLLRLFNSRKLKTKLPQRQISSQANKPIGKHRRLADNDRFFPRNLEEGFVDEDGSVPASHGKYTGNSSRNNEGHDDKRFLNNDGIENDFHVGNYHDYDILKEHPRASLGKRRRDEGGRSSMQNGKEYGDDMDHGVGQVMCNDHPGGSLLKSGKVAEDSQFLLSDRADTKCIMDRKIGHTIACDYHEDSLANLRRAPDDDRFPIRDIVGEKRTQDRSFGLDSSTGHLENPASISSGNRRFFMDLHSVESDRNFGNGPEPIVTANHHVNPFGEVRRTSDDGRCFIDDRLEIQLHSDNKIRPMLSAEYFGDPLPEVKKVSGDDHFFTSGMEEIPAELFPDYMDYGRRESNRDMLSSRTTMYDDHKVVNALGPFISTGQSGYPDKTRRNADEALFVDIDRRDVSCNRKNCFGRQLSTGCTDVWQCRQNPSIYSDKSPFEADYSFCRDQHRPSTAFASPIEKNILESSYPTSHDAIVTRAFPYDSNVSNIHHNIHHISTSSAGVDYTSHSVQDFPPNHSSVGNLFASSAKCTSASYLGAKDLRRHHDVASDCLTQVPLSTNLNNYNFSCCQTSNPSVGADYYGRMEAQATDHEVYEDLHLSEATSASVPNSRSESYGRQNLGSFIEFDKHGVALQGRYEYKIPWQEADRAFSVEDTPWCNTSTGHLEHVSSLEKTKTYDTKSSENSKHMHYDSKSGRTSVFARLTSAPKLRVQENDTCMACNDGSSDASVDDVMDTVYRSLKNRVTKARYLPLGRLRDTEDISWTRNQNMRKDQHKCDKLAMKSMPMTDDVTQVIEENWGQTAEETRVVDFKRRSETKKIWDGPKTKTYTETAQHEANVSAQKPKDEALEDKKHKRRKLVRPVFGKKDQFNEGPSGDGISNDQQLSRQSSSKYKTGSCDASVISQTSGNRSSPNSQLLQLACSTNCEGNNNAGVDQSSICGQIVFENCEACHDNTWNLQLSSQSHVGSNATENNGSCDELLGSLKNQNKTFVNVVMEHTTNPTIGEANNGTNHESSDCRGRNAVICGELFLCNEVTKDGERAVPEDGIGDLPVEKGQF